MEEDLKKLKAARGQAKCSITNICNFTNVIKNLEEYKEEFLEYEEKYFCALSALTEYLTMKQGYSASSSGNASTSLTNNNHTFQRLPPIDIKKFSGKVCEYYDFINLFTSVIANNSSLSSCDKFYYLKTSLEGEAADVIKHLGLTSENYTVALQLLAERYDNKMKIINHHISALLDIECLTKCTAPALRNIVAQAKQHLAALKTLEVPTDQWDLIIICILQRKLDQQTLRYYYLELKDGLHNLQSFLKFIEQRAAAYETVADGYSSSLKRGHAVSGSRTASLVTTSTQNSNNNNDNCKFCNSKYHLLHQCEKFKLSNYSDRINFIESNKLCKLCLRLHSQKCRYAFRCNICKERHNSLLHQEKKPKQVALSMNMGNNILLPTLNVGLHDKSGNVIYTKALCDSGSQVSLVLHDLIKSIDCNIYNEQSVITGIGYETNNISQKAEFTIHSTTNQEALTLSCCVVENITCNMPQFSIDAKELNIPDHVQLGDKNFYKKEKIGILLGCDIFFQLLLRDQIPIVPGGLCLYKTLFGYVVAGKVPRQGNTIQGDENSSSSHLLNVESESQHNLELLNELNTNISQLWECEKITETFTEANTEQELAEKIYKETVELKEGRFHVSLTLKQDYDKIKLGDSLTRALQRFHNLEKRFAKDRDLFLKYKAFIDEYVSLGHAQYIEIEKYNIDDVPFYILPHHPVFNDKSKTTKMRVVFDGGMRTNENVSLNDILLNGPTVQNELFNILTLFRFHKYILISDIKMMFRNLMLDENHCSLQNILWRETPEENIKVIQLKTVTYGLKCSSFLATRSLIELADMYEEDYPLGAFALKHNAYVDDINTGCNDIEELKETKRQLCELLQKGGFELHKWCSNCPELLRDIPLDKQSISEVDLFKSEHVLIKTLGLTYDVSTDTLRINCPEQNLLDIYTKRQVLSFMSKVFDPLGLVGPVVVLAKIIMQRTWACKIQWDQPIPQELNSVFINFAKNLFKMNVSVPRCINTVSVKQIDLVGFSDASSKAHGCCLYIRVIDSEGNISVTLLCSKSRINPLKQLSIPRLELNSALLLAHLVKKVYDEINKLNINPCVYLHSDSQITLAWLKTEPQQLTVYVSNRVKTIQEETQGFSWFYVNSHENPADALSRGVEPHLLETNELWWRGPGFLYCKEFPNNRDNFTMPTDIPETKVCLAVDKAEKQKKLEVFSKFSSLNKLIRVMGYVYRFINICRKKAKRNAGRLSCQEVDASLKMIIKYDQQQHFKEEIAGLSLGKEIASHLKALNPFVDGMGLMRVGGRLQHADLPYYQKHPIILAKKSNITHLIIENEHKTLMHAGQKLMYASLSQRYHIVNGLREIKHVVHKCLICFKLKAKTSEQLMGSLPPDRVNPSRCFEKVGIDFGGPFIVKMHRIRKALTYKAYILLFVCFATKAIHIELASSLTTECFLQCLKRFIARRNKPSVIYCDNASTFKGANNELNGLYKLQDNQQHQDLILDFTTSAGIDFSFIPSYSPVFGGLWEAGIKSAKGHIKRVVGNQILTYEELNSVVIQIEGILNSRPLLSLQTADFNNMSYITPGHFLTGATLSTVPEPNISNIPINRLKFWKQCSHMTQCFWKSWSREYLMQLQSRPKWRKPLPNISKGMLVILRIDNAPPLVWPMARVVETFPGADGKVRALTVITPKGTVMRTSIGKVCLLPIEDNQNQI
ncbi:uncharacterized protein LOC125491356 isoform X1 [Plutella xylostella]|uniref:uncharacterized protein LOC125491356 isoform X1 n=2 Tax=Plutella xylostella TaxID=51655 RepID=UPI002032E384|nr:uncharacterized protein LOC125491356 isoform X1 [Plutella xylostella]